jgi:hypothetical protein
MWILGPIGGARFFCAFSQSNGRGFNDAFSPSALKNA